MDSQASLPQLFGFRLMIDAFTTTSAKVGEVHSPWPVEPTPRLFPQQSLVSAKIAIQPIEPVPASPTEG